MTKFGIVLWMISWVVPTWGVFFAEDDRFRAWCLNLGAVLILLLWGGFLGQALFAWDSVARTGGLPVLGSSVVWVLAFMLYEHSVHPGTTFAERRVAEERRKGKNRSIWL